ncbi:SPFH domain-containing protein [Candidatus Odyssella thessalonicensis]|uniref:SPFH domain-containing protein n=1 Tax=Candidatus Odyssella thessalonicensis TaxID=84647 RepID=UPI000225BEB3|nr:SPFH domain-containing protein [Candidatus Odyssella thessalonicensis]
MKSYLNIFLTFIALSNGSHGGEELDELEPKFKISASIFSPFIEIPNGCVGVAENNQGKKTILEPGKNFVLPGYYQKVISVSLAPRPINTVLKALLSKDNHPLTIKGKFEYQIKDIHKAAAYLHDLENSVTEVFCHTLAGIVRSRDALAVLKLQEDGIAQLAFETLSNNGHPLQFKLQTITNHKLAHDRKEQRVGPASKKVFSGPSGYFDTYEHGPEAYFNPAVTKLLDLWGISINTVEILRLVIPPFIVEQYLKEMRNPSEVIAPFIPEDHDHTVYALALNPSSEPLEIPSVWRVG